MSRPHAQQTTTMSAKLQSNSSSSQSLSSDVGSQNDDNANPVKLEQQRQENIQHQHQHQHQNRNQQLDQPVSRTNSKTSSKKAAVANLDLSKVFSKTSKQPSNIVPISQRRGILLHLCLVPEYHDARNYSLKTKYTIVITIAIAATIGPMGTSIILPAIDDVADVLDTTVSIVNISVGIYLLALGIFPLWWSSISERNGRRSVYLVSFALFLCFSIGSSLSPNIASLVVFRFLMGASSASVQSVGAGTIADLFDVSDRGTAMGYFYLGPLLGPLLAPIIGGAVAIKWGFRGTLWFLVIFAGCLLMFLVFCLPETLRRQDNSKAIADMLAQQQDKRFEEESSLENVGNVSNHNGETEKNVVNNNDFEKRVAINGNNNIDNYNNDRDDLTSLATTLSADALHDNANGINQIEEALSRARTNISNVEQNQERVFDSSVPALSRMNTIDQKQAKKLENAELQRIETRLQGELQRIKSNKSNLSSTVSAKTQKGASSINHQREQSKHDWAHYRTILYIYLIKPTKSVVFLSYPPVLLMIIYSAVSFMGVYFVNMTLSYEYARDPYNFTTMLVGLTYIPNSVCYMLASMLSGRWIDTLIRDFQKKHGFLAPEARLSWNVLIAALMLPGSALIIGWCFDRDNHWETPLVGTALWGFASMLVIGTTVTYIVDSLPGRGATGVALNNLIRQILATIACFVVEPLIKALGVGVLYSIIAGVLFVFGILFAVVKRYGSYWRDHYDLARLYEIVDS